MEDNQLIATMYDVVGDHARWTDVLDAIKVRLGVASAVFQSLTTHNDNLIPLMCMRDTWSMREADRHDAWANSLHNPRFRRDTEPRDQNEIDSDHNSLALTSADRDVMRRGLASCGLGPAFWLGCKTGPGEHTTMIFHRHVGDGRDVTDAEMAFLYQLLPHFRQVCSLIGKVAGYEARLSVAENFMSSTSLALVACDADLGILWMNAAAQRLVDALPQMALSGNRLRFRAHEAQAAARDAIRGLNGSCCRIAGDEAADMLHLRVLSREANLYRYHGRSFALVALCTPNAAPTINIAEVADLFGLTRAEATLTTHLVGGMTVKEFAACRGIAEGTARMQLKSALGKVGVGRQTDLVRQVCQSLARV